jgi:hypothetical protein
VHLWDIKDNIEASLEISTGNLCPVQLKKVMLLWVSGHSGILGSEDADTLARNGSCSSFLGPKPTIPISQCDGRFKIKQWLRKKHDRNKVVHWRAFGKTV